MQIFYGWYVVLALFVAVSLAFGLAYYNSPVFYPAYIDEFHWSRAVVASGGSLSFFIFGIMSPFIGVLADRISVKKIILVGIICDGLSKVSFSLVHSLPHYYLTNVLVGVGIACTGIITQKLLIAKWFKQREGLALGIAIAGTSVGGGVGPTLTSYVLGEFGWRGTHLVLSSLVLGIASPVFWFVAKDRPQEMGLLPDGMPLQEPAMLNNNKALSRVQADACTDLTLGQALTTPTFWLLCSAVLLFYVCSISITQHLVLHLTDIGLNLASASAALSLLLSASVLGRAGFGALSDRYSKKQLTIVACLLLAVTSFTLFLLGVPWLARFARSATTIYATAALIGIGYGGGVVCIPIIVGNCFGLSSLGKIFGLIIVFNALGGAIGPTLTGRLFDISGSYQLAFFLISLAAFAAAGCLAFIKTNLRTVHQEAATNRTTIELVTP